MAQGKPESPDWLDDLAAVTALRDKTPSASHDKLAKALNLHRSDVSQLIALEPILDPPTLKKIRQAASGAPPNPLSFKSAKELTRLNGRVADYPKTGREVVDQVLSQRLVTSQIKALVAHIAAGKLAQDFDPSKPLEKPVSKGAPNKAGDEAENDEAEVDGETSEADESAPKAAQTLGQKLDGAITFFTVAKKGKTPIADVFKLGFRIFKGIIGFGHPLIKPIANSIVPLHKSGSSSGHKQDGSQAVQNPLRVGLHWAVIIYLTVVLYAAAIRLLGHLITPIQHWAEPVSAYLFKLALYLPVWALTQALKDPWIALGIGALVLLYIYRAFKPGFGWLVFTAALLVAAWWFRGLWESYLPGLPSFTAATPQAKEAPATPVVVPTTVPAAPSVGKHPPRNKNQQKSR